MKFLYIFPHPDDESFGPAGGIHSQIKQGHKVYLLTLTKGGATRMRHKLKLSVKEMGEVRYREMQKVAKTLGLSGMEVLDLPDSGLKEVSPLELENVIEEHIKRIEPQIIVTYPVHGISGFHDHIVTHFAVKNIFVRWDQKKYSYLKRLAFFTVLDNGESSFMEKGFRIKGSDPEQIDCRLLLSKEDISAFRASLACYESYQEVIAQTGVIDSIGDTLLFEIYGVNFDPPLNDLSHKI